MPESPSDSWWRHAVVYQVYIRSFADGNGDGIGDIGGLLSRLGHVADLGVDAIWINPWYESPLRDGGYDVADYRRIDPRLGTLDDAVRLVEEAHAREIKVLLDLVPNHTSVEHEWFRTALESAPGSHERRRYHFLDGRGPDGASPPNDWQSLFGGPAWTQVEDGQWYLHLFDSSQPDLNWRNPEVAEEFDDILRFWMDLGFDGFRVDVAHAISKDPSYPDLGGPLDVTASADGTHAYWDRDEIHDVFRRWRAIVDAYPDRMLVAEASVGLDRLPLYLRRGEFDQAFNFEFLKAGWDGRRMRSVIERSLHTTTSVGAVPTWVLSNHDEVRHATRLGLDPARDLQAWLLAGKQEEVDEQLGLRRALALTMLALGLPGSTYLYQGEELGLPEVHDLPHDSLMDPEWRRSGGKKKGRDGCRVPLPWTAEGRSFGFSTSEPWLPVPAHWGNRSVDSQTGDPTSPLELYRDALRIRSEMLRHDAFEWLDLTQTLAFRRDRVLVVTNFGPNAIPLPAGEILVSSSPLHGRSLPADTTAWLTT